jgi:hypothetical protein
MPRSIRSLSPIALFALLQACSDSSGPSGFGDPGDLRQTFSHGTCTGSGSRRITAAPMAPADVKTVVPMGAVAGAHVTPIDHQYYVPLDLMAGRTAYAVRAPITGFIVLVQHRTVAVVDPGQTVKAPDEYRIVFEGSCTFWVYYDLVTQLDPSVAAAVAAQLQTNMSANVRIPVTAGQVIGRIGGQTLDLGVVDANVTLPGFVVPSHYVAEPWKIHTVDPFDYMDEPARSQLLALNPRTASPRGGKIDHDVDGTAAGNWFQAGTNGYAGLVMSRGWAGHLALTYGHIDPTKIVISIGTYQGSARAFGVLSNMPDPRTITEATGVVKYEMATLGYGIDGAPFTVGPVVGVVLLQVMPGRQLKVEVVPNGTAATVSAFTSAAVMYER